MGWFVSLNKFPHSFADSPVVKRFGSKVIKKRNRLSQEIKKAIIALVFGLVLITVVLSVVFLLNTSNSAQKGYVHSQLRIQNEELDNINKDLKIKVLKARSILHLEDTQKIIQMVQPEKSTYITD